jgi:hypothetical protein
MQLRDMGITPTSGDPDAAMRAKKRITNRLPMGDMGPPLPPKDNNQIFELGQRLVEELNLSTDDMRKLGLIPEKGRGK